MYRRLVCLAVIAALAAAAPVRADDRDEQIKKLQEENARLKEENRKLREAFATLAAPKTTEGETKLAKEKASQFIQGVVDHDTDVMEQLSEKQQEEKLFHLGPSEFLPPALVKRSQAIDFAKHFIPEGKFKGFSIDSEAASEKGEEVVFRGKLESDESSGAKAFSITMIKEQGRWVVDAFKAAK